MGNILRIQSTTITLQVLATILNIVQNVLIVKLFSACGRGVVAVYTNNLVFATSVLSLSIPTALVYFMASKRVEEHVAKIISIGFIGVMALFTTLIALSIYIGKWPLVQLTGVHSNTLAMLWCMHLLASIIAAINTAWANSKQLFVWPILAQIVYLLTTVSILLAYHYQLWSGSIINVLYYSATIFIAVQLALGIYLLKPHGIQAPNIPSGIIPQMLQYNAIAFACNAIQMLAYRVDIWVLQYYNINTDLIGKYAIALMVVQLLWLVPNQIASILFTYTSAKLTSPNIITRLFAQLWWYSVLAIGVALLCCQWLIPLVFGISLTISATILWLMWPGIAAISAALVISTYNAAAGKLQFNLKASIAGAISGIASLLIFVKYYNIYGAAIGFSIINVTNAAVLLNYFATDSNITLAKLFTPQFIKFKHYKATWHELQQ
jgi:O-antigen/teichoic acid export membrane protein